MPSKSFGWTWWGSDKFSSPADRVSRAAARVEMHADKMGRAGARASEKWAKAGTSMRGAGANMSVFSAAIGLVAGAALKQSANFEMLGVSFEVLIGDAEKAKEVFAELTEFATKTPFKLDEVAQAGKTLLAFQVDADEVGTKLKHLGDLAAASGKPLTEFANIFGKIKAKGRVTMEEVNQLAEKGVSIQTELANRTRFTSAEIGKMIEQGAISFEDIDLLIEKMTTGEGKFAGLAAEQAKTLAGRWSTLAGNIDIALATVGDTIVEMFDLKSVIEKVGDAILVGAEKFKSFAEAHPQILKVVLVMILLFAAIGPVLLIVGQFALAISSIAAAAPLVATGIGAISGAVATLAGALGLTVGTLLLIPLLIAAAGLAVWALWENWDTVSALIDEAIAIVIGKIAEMGEWFSGVGDSIAGFFGFGDAELEQSSTFVGRLDIGIAATQGTQVDSVSSSSSGTSGVALGVHNP